MPKFYDQRKTMNLMLTHAQMTNEKIRLYYQLHSHNLPLCKRFVGFPQVCRFLWLSIKIF